MSKCDIKEVTMILVVWLPVDACYATHLLYSCIKKNHKVQNVEK